MLRIQKLRTDKPQSSFNQSLDNKKHKNRVYGPSILILFGITLSLIYFLWVIVGIVYPEVPMVLQSTCRNPLRGWNGKLGKLRLWVSNEYKGNDAELKSGVAYNSVRNFRLESRTELKPRSQGHIIMFGTHHKTGTFAARKIFSIICAQLQLCCIFHTSRVSLENIYDIFNEEPTVHIIGHNQWAWYPEDVARNRPYKFIHFHRDPIEKILSGFHYHRSGTESWTKNHQPYENACLRPSIMNNDTMSLVNNAKEISLYCKFSHICKHCCQIKLKNIVAQSNDGFIHYEEVFKVLCDTIGQVNSSIQEALHRPDQRGIITESALTYFENLRMAEIIAHTKNDPDTLNIDINSLSLAYDETVISIINHLNLNVPPKMIYSIFDIVKRYDIKDVGYNAGMIYRTFMSSFLFNHIGDIDEKVKYQLLRQEFLSNSQAQTMYRPIYDLLQGVYVM